MRMRRLIPWLIPGARILLGAVFIFAALPKLADPPAFAKAIWNYQLVPEALLSPLALTLPWLELLCGLALVLGVWTRPAAAWVAILLTGFMLSLGLNLARNHPVDCGCFGSPSQPRSEAERLSDMKVDIARDAGLLALALLLLLSSGKGRPEP